MLSRRRRRRRISKPNQRFMINLSHLINQTLIECGKRPMRLEKIKSIKMLNLMMGLDGMVGRERERYGEENENLLGCCCRALHAGRRKVELN